MERLLDEVSFDAPNRAGQTVRLDAAAVDAQARRPGEERRPVALHPLGPGRDAAALVYQSLWAMERRRPDGLEWSLDEKLDMIHAAGFDGAGVRFFDRDYVRQVTQSSAPRA